MPLLDVSWVTVDPMFADSFVVKRRAETVNAYGESTVVATPVATAYGTITAADPQDLQRRDDGATQSRGISVITPYHLRGMAQGYQPDVITYDGEDYTVTRCEPYHRFGTGFFEATAEIMEAQVAPK